jgi:hypothetical protein
MKRKGFVEDRWSGISLGREYKYRLIKYKNKYIIFDYTTGEIVEHIKKGKHLNDFFYTEKAMKRLWEINVIKKNCLKK